MTMFPFWYIHSAYVNFFIDGIYLGTNNAFVPTRGSRLWISLWPAKTDRCSDRAPMRTQ